jgi:hypothetical protein
MNIIFLSKVNLPWMEKATWSWSKARYGYNRTASTSKSDRRTRIKSVTKSKDQTMSESYSDSKRTSKPRSKSRTKTRVLWWILFFLKLVYFVGTAGVYLGRLGIKPEKHLFQSPAIKVTQRLSHRLNQKTCLDLIRKVNGLVDLCLHLLPK